MLECMWYRKVLEGEHKRYLVNFTISYSPSFSARPMPGYGGFVPRNAVEPRLVTNRDIIEDSMCSTSRRTYRYSIIYFQPILKFKCSIALVLWFINGVVTFPAGGFHQKSTNDYSLHATDLSPRQSHWPTHITPSASRNRETLVMYRLETCIKLTVI